MGRPIGIDLFAGAGGMSLGFEQAGFDVAAAVELDPVHAAVHAFNFPRTAVLAASVIGLPASEIRRAAKIGNRRVNVVFGGAPCQGFSLIGHRQLDDPRNLLVREFVRITAELKADYAVFENVKGLTVGRHRAFLEELVEAFHAQGYSVKLPWQVLNAAHFGVPQHRERLFLIAARRGLRMPSYPVATTRAAGEEGRLPAGPTCKDALGDLPDADSFPALQDADEVVVRRWRKPSGYAAELRCLTNDAWHYGYVRDWNPELLTSSLRTEHTEISRRRFLRTPQGTVEPISRFYRLAADGVCNTLRAGTDSARGAFTSPRPIHHEHPRCVTVREMLRLHGYPDWFRAHSTKWHGAREVGNSVPPPLARAVATELIRAGNYQLSRPSETLALGDEAVLRFEMSEAAAYFGVPNPIGRRNKKSGARKRKQHEIEALMRAAE